MGRKTANYLGTLIAAVASALLIIFIVLCQTKRFHETLYIYSNLLSTQHIFLITIRRVIMAVALYAFGLSCIFLFFISYEEADFLSYSKIFWYAAGLVISIWDYELVFYASAVQAVVWRVSQGLCLLLLLNSINQALLNQFRFRRFKRFRLINEGAGAGYLLLLLPFNFLYPGTRITSFLCILEIVFMITAALLYSIEKEIKTDFVNYILLIFYLIPSILLVVCSRYKYLTLSAGYDIYKDILPAAVLIYVVCLFLCFFQYHRTGYLAGGEVNRKLMELSKHKDNMTQLIISNCLNPINNLSCYQQTLAEEVPPDASEKEKYILDRMLREINKMQDYLYNLRNYHYLSTQVPYANKINANLVSVFHAAISLVIKQAGTLKINTDWGEITENDYVTGDPYLLIQANQTFLLAFCGILEMETIGILFQKNKKGDILIELAGDLNQSRKKAAKKMRRILTSPRDTQLLMNDEEIGLILAKNHIRNHTNSFTAHIRQNGPSVRFAVNYKLEGCGNPMVEGEARNQAGPDETENRKKIILISTDAEQIERIRSYLMFEDYVLKCFYTEKEALNYIKTSGNIGVVIIGTIFISAHVNRFCESIREKYSLEQLPILIICRDKYRYVDQELLRSVNDIMAEPFVQADLLQKIQSLILLHTSIQEKTRARLDFLQAQMDPHFIFNTLSTIMPLCLQQPLQAYEMLSNFSEYLRGRLYTEDLQDGIPIYKEIDLVEAYLAIEKVRFADMIQYEIQMEADENDLILPLLIEPIVENCVKHGITGIKKLNIEIRIRETDGYLAVCIKDDGKGMDEERLEEILHSGKQAGSSIGISNVKKRLSMYYNQQLVIISSPNNGTEVQFTIPKGAIRYE